MTCKECIHFEICANVYGEVTAETEIKNIENKDCYYFNPKFMEPPCKIGDTAYFIWNFNEPEIQKCNVKEYRLKSNGFYVVLNYIDFLDECCQVSFLVGQLNKSWYLAKSEAEQKLKEINNER